MMRRALTVHRLPTTDGAIGGCLCLVGGCLCLVVTVGVLSFAAELCCLLLQSCAVFCCRELLRGEKCGLAVAKRSLCAILISAHVNLLLIAIANCNADTKPG